jgi:hypothetical protein
MNGAEALRKAQKKRLTHSVGASKIEEGSWPSDKEHKLLNVCFILMMATTTVFDLNSIP